MNFMNYLELKNLVKNNFIHLSFNENLYNHPMYNNLSISEIDNKIKEFSFNNKFSLLSTNINTTEINNSLKNEDQIFTFAVLDPMKPFIHNHDNIGFKKTYTHFINHMRSELYVSFRPREVQIIPLSVNIIKSNPNVYNKIIGKLNQDLLDKGLKLINLVESSFKNEHISAVIANTTRSTVKINDLQPILNIHILK